MATAEADTTTEVEIEDHTEEEMTEMEDSKDTITGMIEHPEEISEGIDPKDASTVANKGTLPEIVLNVLLKLISARKPR